MKYYKYYKEENHTFYDKAGEFESCGESTCIDELYDEEEDEERE